MFVLVTLDLLTAAISAAVSIRVSRMFLATVIISVLVLAIISSVVVLTVSVVNALVVSYYNTTRSVTLVDTMVSVLQCS